METIRGKASRQIDLTELRQRLTGYSDILLDLGTGDGRYVDTVARQQPGRFAIGVDACRENLREHSHNDRPNMLFLIAEAAHLPPELSKLVTHLTINFPWGSLLEGLLSADPALMETLACIAAPAASLEVRLNAGGLAEIHSSLEAGAERVQCNLSRSGWLVGAPRAMQEASLRSFPSTWARRLAHGRDPRAVQIDGRLARS